MNLQIKILIAEHDPVDIELMQQQLKTGGVKYIAEIVQNEREYINAIKSFIPDIILSDYTFPSFDGPAAFKIKEVLAPHTPFIIVSGTIGEEKAIELIKAGVTDFVLKDRLLSLPVKIKRALKEAKEKVEKNATAIALQTALIDIKKIMDSSLDVICAVDTAGCFVQVSAACETVWGYTPEELIGNNVLDFVYPADRQKTIKASSEVMVDGRLAHFENRYVHKNGALVPMVWSGRWNATDQLSYGVARDATEIKRLEKISETERQRFNDLFLQAPSCMGILKGPEHVFEMANPLYLQLISKKDIIGKSVIDVMPEVEAQGFIKLLDGVYRTGKTFSAYEMLIKLDTGNHGKLTDVYLNFIYQAYRNNEGSVEGIFFFAIDVTEQVLSRKKIEETEKRYRQIVETAQEGIWLIDEHNSTTLVNKKMCEIIEYSAGEIMGEKIYHFMDDESRKNSMEQIERRKQGLSEIHDSMFITKSGKQVWVNISTNPVFDDDGTYKGALAMATDITERRLSEILLNEMNSSLIKHAKELAISNTELEQFAYVASHDLQEPLRMVTSFLTQLEKKYGDVIDEKGKKYIAFAVDGAKRMRQIILDLLEFSRVGRMEDKLETLNINEIVEEIEILFRKDIKDRQASVHKVALPVITAYKVPLRQVFQNLVSNGLKYSKPAIPSQVEITAIELKTHWQFAVTDNGIGISKEYFDKIFIIFQQLHNKNDYSGTGMGLSVSKKIVENMGGKIWVESEEGKGSTFYFTLLKN